MKLSRDARLGIGLLVLLVGITVAAALQQDADAIPNLSTSAGRSGSLAFRRWLGDLGYQVLDEQPGFFEPPREADLILILSPLLEITESELKSLDGWVEDGGTLILAGATIPLLPAFEHFGFSMRYLDRPARELLAQTPILTSPPLTDPAIVDAEFYLRTDRTDFVAHLALAERPVIVSFERGKGRVILSTVAHPFSNLGLKEAGNAELVLNLVSLAVRRGAVWFDEWHHGIQNNILGPEQWLRRTSAGHALVFVALAVFLALIMQGRGFGRPVPLPYELRRRGPLEHVTAVANLNRRAGHRAATLHQYHQRLKRHLGKRYRLDPSLPDADYVRALGGYNPSIDQKELLDLLTRLSQENVSEGELVKLADEASKWMMER
ncbi:MAG: DUF4350 domain-containing protein [Chloroflexota bacterium]